MKILFYCVFSIALMTTVSSAQFASPTPMGESVNQLSYDPLGRLESTRTQRIPFPGSYRLSRIGSSKIEYVDLSPLYRKTTDKELQLLAPNAEDLRKYDDFLRQSNTGIIKLAEDKGCSENLNVMITTPDCSTYSMPGAGSSFSFRVNDYRIPRLADITFSQNSFQATGINLHGIFVELGDVPLEQVNLQTKGLEFPVNFNAEPDSQKARELDQQLIKGIENNGFLYSRSIGIKNNMTYVLRSIAYRGKYLRTENKLTYNELDFDKRNDVIIAFRVVRLEEDGSVTILWKQLAKQDSPKIK